MENRANVKQDTENEIVIRQDMEDGRLQALLKEYELAIVRLEGLDNRVFQFLSGGLLVLGFVAAYVLNLHANPPLLAAWVIPLFGITVYSILLSLGYLISAGVFNARVLTQQINRIVKETTLIRFERNMPESRFFSTNQRGNIKPKVLYVVLFGTACFIYFPIVAICLRVIYENNHLYGSLFVLVYAFFVVLVLFSASGVLFDLPHYYDGFLRKSALMNGREQIHSHPKIIPTSTLRTAFATIIPRSWDVIAKGPFFLYGFVAALIVSGIQYWKVQISGLPYNQLQIANFLFRADHDWHGIVDVPIIAVLGLGVIFFIVEELLLQQAKLTWDDIRDVKRDRDILRNDRRPIANGVISIPSAIRQMIFRWMLALLLGFLLGGFVLLIVFLLISLHQIIYMLYAKPRGGRHPIAILFFLSITVPLRFLAGVVAVVGTQWTLAPFVLLYVLFYFCSFGGLAVYWKMEAEHYDIEKKELPRPLSKFYLEHGLFWQHLGLVAAVLFGFFMVFIQYLTVSCASQLESLQLLYGYCAPNGLNLHYVTLGWIIILYILGLITAFTVLTAFVLKFFAVFYQLLVSRFAKVRSLKLDDFKKIKTLIMAILFLSATALFVTLLLELLFKFNIFPGLGWNNTYVLFWSFLLLNAGYLLMFEGMTYLKYTNTDLWNRLPCIKEAWYDFLFIPNKNVGLKELIEVMSSDCDKDAHKASTDLLKNAHELSVD